MKLCGIGRSSCLLAVMPGAASGLNAFARVIKVSVRDKSSQRDHSPNNSRVRSFKMKLMARSKSLDAPICANIASSSSGKLLGKLVNCKLEASVVTSISGLDK